MYGNSFLSVKIWVQNVWRLTVAQSIMCLNSMSNPASVNQYTLKHHACGVLYNLHIWICGYSITSSMNHHHLKTHFSEDMHFFQNNKRRWCIKTGTGRQQQYINNGLTLCLQNELKIFRNELFHATLAERMSSERACHVSQPYRSEGRQYVLTKWTATISFLFGPFTRNMLLSAL